MAISIVIRRRLFLILQAVLLARTFNCYRDWVRGLLQQGLDFGG